MVLAQTTDSEFKPSTIAKPFLKWAGGKAQLLQQFDSFFPVELQEGNIHKYVEPFTGSGAVFFYVIQNFPGIRSAVLCDANEELIRVFLVIQRDVKELIMHLRKQSAIYEMHCDKKRADYFNMVRNQFNRELSREKLKKYTRDWIPRAAQFIFLNKTCYNGLYRVNKRGHFNAPFGKYAKPKILDAANLLKVSELLSIVELRAGDYSTIKKTVGKRTFVYLDPPYRPISKTANFTSYSKEGFHDNEQERLAQFYRSLNAKGCKLMLSNSDPTNTDEDDRFFHELYDGFSIGTVEAKRMINCQAGKRGKIRELVITNY